MRIHLSHPTLVRALVLNWLVVAGAWAQASLDSPGRLVNAAWTPAAGQGLTAIHGAEPLGTWHARVGVLNQSRLVYLPGLGAGRAHTGMASLAYGLTAHLDVSLVFPFMLDTAGEHYKYGTGDPVFGVKLALPGRVPAGFYTAVQVLVGVPLGYQGEHALDRFDGGIRSFSSGSVDAGVKLLADVHGRWASLYFNGGYLLSRNPQIMPELVYGTGVELGRRHRWASVNAEYWSRVAVAAESQPVAAVKAGVRLNVYRGLQVEVNQEWGLAEHKDAHRLSAGLRMHGRLARARGLVDRFTLYQPQPPVQLPYAPERTHRIAVVGFSGFADVRAGDRLVERLRRQLAPYENLEFVDLERYADVTHHGYLRPVEAAELARKLQLDVVITGELEKYAVKRLAGPLVPFVYRLPEARVALRLHYRVLEFDADQIPRRTVIDQVEGSARVQQRLRLLPADRRDVTSAPTAPQLNEVETRAIDDLAAGLLADLADRFDWIPPEFLR